MAEWTPPKEAIRFFVKRGRIMGKELTEPFTVWVWPKMVIEGTAYELVVGQPLPAVCDDWRDSASGRAMAISAKHGELI
jgi:hypothetical protein